MGNYNVKTLRGCKIGPFTVHIKAKLKECVNCKSPTNIRVPFNQKVSKQLFAKNRYYSMQKDSYVCSAECIKNVLMSKLFELKVAPTKEIEAFLTGPTDTRYRFASLKDSKGEDVFVSLFKYSETEDFPYVYIYAQRYNHASAWWRGLPVFVDDKGVRFLQELFRKDF